MYNLQGLPGWKICARKIALHIGYLDPSRTAFAERNTITLLPLLPSVQIFFATFCRDGSAGATRRARNWVVVFTSISVRRAGAQES